MTVVCISHKGGTLPEHREQLDENTLSKKSTSPVLRRRLNPPWQANIWRKAARRQRELNQRRLLRQANRSQTAVKEDDQQESMTIMNMLCHLMQEQQKSHEQQAKATAERAEIIHRLDNIYSVVYSLNKAVNKEEGGTDSQGGENVVQESGQMSVETDICEELQVVKTEEHHDILDLTCDDDQSNMWDSKMAETTPVAAGFVGYIPGVTAAKTNEHVLHSASPGIDSSGLGTLGSWAQSRLCPERGDSILPAGGFPLETNVSAQLPHTSTLNVATAWPSQTRATSCSPTSQWPTVTGQSYSLPSASDTAPRMNGADRLQSIDLGHMAGSRTPRTMHRPPGMKRFSTVALPVKVRKNTIGAPQLKKVKVQIDSEVLLAHVQGIGREVECAKHFVLKLVDLLFSREELAGCNIKGGILSFKGELIRRGQLDTERMEMIYDFVEQRFPGFRSEPGVIADIHKAVNSKCRNATMTLKKKIGSPSDHVM